MGKPARESSLELWEQVQSLASVHLWGHTVEVGQNTARDTLCGQVLLPPFWAPRRRGSFQPHLATCSVCLSKVRR